MRLENKTEFYRLYRAGLLGNRLAVWSPEEFEVVLARGAAPARVAVRGLQPGSRDLRFGLRPSEALRLARARGGAWICEQAPDDDVLLQGVVQEFPGGWCLHYAEGCAGLRWREALEGHGRHAYGLEARARLMAVMDGPSWDTLLSLLECFDGAAVEFSVYRRGVGERRWNTIFWEVRHY